MLSSSLDSQTLSARSLVQSASGASYSTLAGVARARWRLLDAVFLTRLADSVCSLARPVSIGRQLLDARRSGSRPLAPARCCLPHSTRRLCLLARSSSQHRAPATRRSPEWLAPAGAC